MLFLPNEKSPTNISKLTNFKKQPIYIIRMKSIAQSTYECKIGKQPKITILHKKDKTTIAMTILKVFQYKRYLDEFINIVMSTTRHN